jgi:hypothetical protein
LPAAAVAAILSGCAFDISAPKTGAVVGSPTKVVVESTASMSGLEVRVDGTDYSNQILSVGGSDKRSEGNLNLAPGAHTITAEADVYCWYCSQRTSHRTDREVFCVGGGMPVLGPLTKVAISESDGRHWFKTTNNTIGLGIDTGTPAFRWNMIRRGGIGSSTGLIQSAEDACLCMTSTNDRQDTPIGLAFCDWDDPTQQWQALQITTGVFLFQNTGRGISDACLTEGPNNELIQRANKTAANQHWRIRDNTTGQVGGSPF